MEPPLNNCDGELFRSQVAFLQLLRAGLTIGEGGYIVLITSTGKQVSRERAEGGQP